jgi:uncharacterized protein
MLTLYTVLLYSMIFVILFPLLKSRHNKKSFVYFLLFIVLFIADQFLTRYRFIPILESHYWNWSGKLQSIILGVTFILIYRKVSFEEYKFTLRQLSGSLRKTLILLFSMCLLNAILCFAVKYLFHIQADSNVTSLESLLFHLTMPGVSEELMFRGILLGLLNQVFEKRMSTFGIKFGWGLILTSLLFGMWHGLSVTQGFGIYFSIENILLAGFGGFVFGLIAENSGSLLFPIMCHDLNNTIEVLINMLP